MRYRQDLNAQMSAEDIANMERLQLLQISAAYLRKSAT